MFSSSFLSMYSCFSVTSILCVCVGAYLDRTTYCTNCPLDDITLIIISGGWGSLVRLVFWVHQYHWLQFLSHCLLLVQYGYLERSFFLLVKNMKICTMQRFPLVTIQYPLTVLNIKHIMNTVHCCSKQQLIQI